MPGGAEPSTIHLKPSAELAERVLLPGDPGRALAVAQDLLDKPLMFNLNRGLWGYTGTAGDGEPLTIQSTGMGGPSAAIVVEELIALGARRLVRIGTCGALDPGLGLGELLTAVAAVPEDGTSRALGARETVRADVEVSEGLVAAGGGRRATVVSTDLFYDAREGREDEWLARGAVAVEMEAATVLRVAELHGVRAGCLLAVSDRLDGRRRRLGEEELREAGVRLGAVALEALTR